MHIRRKPGESLEVDWAGDTVGVKNVDTGERMPAYVFVSALSYSGYAWTTEHHRIEIPLQPFKRAADLIRSLIHGNYLSADLIQRNIWIVIFFL